jgi:nicotinamidase-related amidase
MDIATDAALLVIDVQQGFEDAAFWGRRDNPDAERNVAALVDTWQRTGRPVVVVQHASRTSPPLYDGTPGYALKPVVADVEPSLLVRKSVNSAFYGTPDLHDWLIRAGIGQLVLCGIQTNMCVETTARMAGNLGYDVLFPADAMHTFDLAGPDGTVLSAEELTRATVTTLHGGGFARVVPTADVVRAATAAVATA